MSDSQRQDPADKRAARKASLAMVAAHNARVMADRAALAAHVAQYGEDGFECA